MVTAMGGMLHTRASSDISFVIVKNVLAQKYKVILFLLSQVMNLNSLVGVRRVWLGQGFNSLLVHATSYTANFLKKKRKETLLYMNKFDDFTGVPFRTECLVYFMKMKQEELKM